MSKPVHVDDNSDNKLRPPAKELDPGAIVPDGNAGPVKEEEEAAAGNVNHEGFDPAEEKRSSDPDRVSDNKAFAGLDNNLVNAGKFSDPAMEDEGLSSAEKSGRRDDRTVAEAFGIEPRFLYEAPTRQES